MYRDFVREKRVTSGRETAFYGKIKKLHWPLMLMVTLMCMIGFTMLYSAAGGNLEPWALKQAIRFAVAIPVLILIAVIDIKVWYRYSYLFYFIGICLLIMVILAGFLGKGAQRWIDLGPINLQPSELMKIFLVLALARYFHNVHYNEVDKISRLVVPAIMIVVPVILILKQPNLGTATIIFLTGVGIFFITGVGWRKFIISAIIVLSMIPIAWTHLHDYQKRRVYTFLNPDNDPLGAGYNIIQSKIAIGSGGFYGKGFLQGSQSQLNFLPEKQTDFIFTVLTEESGFIGGVFVLMLYLFIIFCNLKIAQSCENHFARLVVIGLNFVLFFHIAINIAMVMGLLPVVGLPLPLLSYGGSIMVTMLVSFGFIMNAHIYRESNLY